MSSTSVYSLYWVVFERKNLCDVRMMIDHDVAEKMYENKVGMSS